MKETLNLIHSKHYLGPIGHCVEVSTTTTTTTTLPPLPPTLVPTSPSPPTTLPSSYNVVTVASLILNQQQQQQRLAQLTACSSENCLNGGTCQGHATNYTCICASGFKGLI